MTEKFARPSPLHEPWLDNAEKRFLTIFETLKCVFLEIVQEALKRSVSLSSNERDSTLAKENELLQIKCKKLEEEHKRFARNVNTKLEMWNKNFQILKKKYRQLKHFYENQEKTKYSFANDSKTGTQEKIKNEIKNHENIIKENIEDLDSNRIHNVSGIADDTGSCHNSKEGQEIGVILVENDKNPQPQEIKTHRPRSETFVKEEKNTDGENSNSYKIYRKKRLLKDSHQDPLKNKRKTYVKYQENASQAKRSDSSGSQIKDLKGKQVKRQSRDFHHERSLEQKVKEPRLNSPELQVMIVESQEQNLSEGSDKRSQENTNRSLNRKSCAKTEFTLPTPRIPLPDTAKKESFKSQIIDIDATIWHPDDQVGNPFLASTPVMEASTHKDLDDTMWSAPKSPTVVSSMFITPEKATIVPASKEKIPSHVKFPFKCPRRKTIQKYETHGCESPSLFKSIQSDKSDCSRDSLCHSRKDGFNQMTSAADLSDDMFHRDTMSSGEQEGKVCCNNSKESCEEDEARDRKKRSRANSTEVDDHFIESFNKKAQDDVMDDGIKYKYNAVIRKRGDRDKMDGYQCPECAAWYEDDDNDEDKKKHLKNICRHKAVSSPPPSTPNGFWSLGFPDTQQCIEQGYMLDENKSIPYHAKPKSRKEKAP